MSFYLSFVIASFLFSSLLVPALSSNWKDFDGYQVIRIKVDTQFQLQTIQKLTTLVPSIDHWNEPEVGKYADVMVSPASLPELVKYLGEGFHWRIFIKDVGRLIKEQSLATTRGNLANWTQYQTLDEIFEWMDLLQTQFPDVVSTQTIGLSYEERPIRLLKVSKGNGNDTASRPAVFLDSGIHAREWISPATLTFVMDRLITDPEYADILEALDIHAVPILNPDGYEFTHTTNRMWRKNRRPNPDTNCFGTDLNRNFPFQWCTTGASNESCSESYCGSGPGSEPETQVITNYLLRDLNWWGYVSLHSYAQEWCIPWAYTAEHHTDYEAMMELGRKAVRALEGTHGTPYFVKIPTGRYGGFSMDWAKGVRGIKYPVLIELRDTGEYGFLLPADQIIPSGQETLAAIAVYLREIAAEIATRLDS